MQAFTSDLFVVTSEWDTQIARSVRGGTAATDRFNMTSYVFSNFCGTRPAEACSLTVAATHELLTQLLLYLINATIQLNSSVQGSGHKLFSHSDGLGGCTFDDRELRELHTLNSDSIDALQDIVRLHSATSQALRAQGKLWAAHILESPISWIMSAVYILATVVVGETPLSGTAGAMWTTRGASRPWWAYLVGLLDALIYMFLPWWTTVLLPPCAVPSMAPSCCWPLVANWRYALGQPVD